MTAALRILLGLAVVGLVGILTAWLPMAFAWSLVALAIFGTLLAGVIGLVGAAGTRAARR